jgi:hypothetical protein
MSRRAAVSRVKGLGRSWAYLAAVKHLGTSPGLLDRIAAGSGLSGLPLGTPIANIRTRAPRLARAFEAPTSAKQRTCATGSARCSRRYLPTCLPAARCDRHQISGREFRRWFRLSASPAPPLMGIRIELRARVWRSHGGLDVEAGVVWRSIRGGRELVSPSPRRVSSPASRARCTQGCQARRLLIGKHGANELGATHSKACMPPRAPHLRVPRCPLAARELAASGSDDGGSLGWVSHGRGSAGIIVRGRRRMRDGMRQG